MSAATQSDGRVLAGSASRVGAPGAAAGRVTPLWERRAFYRYGFLALILVVWEVT